MKSRVEGGGEPRMMANVNEVRCLGAIIAVTVKDRLKAEIMVSKSVRLLGYHLEGGVE
jgi:hypothetical protein